MSHVDNFFMASSIGDEIHNSGNIIHADFFPTKLPELIVCSFQSAVLLAVLVASSISEPDIITFVCQLEGGWKLIMNDPTVSWVNKSMP